jgi:hypothetical protein
MKRIFKYLLLSLALAAVSCTSLFAAEYESLLGRWQRPDGGYILEIRNIASDGNAEVRYLNPRPIHVARAEVSTSGDKVKLFVELQDVGYPGSTYTLVYDPKKDILLGIYFQAGMGQYFDVVFVRMR